MFGSEKKKSNDFNMEQYYPIVSEVCDKFGENQKVAAIKEIREKTDLGLIDAKKLVDTYFSGDYASIYSNRQNEIINPTNDLAISVQTNISITAGAESLGINSQTAMLQNDNGEVFFKNNSNKYFLTAYSWSGPQYKTTTQSQTIGTTSGETKRKGRFIGAVIGSVLVPGVGTVLGAAHGTGNKKSKGSLNSQTITNDIQTEVNTPATIKLKNIKTGQVIGITILCNSFIDSQLRRFSLEDELCQPLNDISSTVAIDPYEEIKKAKELLDLGIITQEEFDIKKKELLGL